jgi:hypothetical protein
MDRDLYPVVRSVANMPAGMTQNARLLALTAEAIDDALTRFDANIQLLAPRHRDSQWGHR